MNLSGRIQSWWGGRLYRKLIVSSIGILLFSLMLLGYLSWSVGQTAMRNEVDQRNDKLATLVAREINAEFTNIWNNLHLFMNELDVTPDKLTFQVRVMLALRLTESLTYRSLHLFDSQAQPLVQLDDSIHDLLAIRDITEIVNRPARPIRVEVAEAVRAAQAGETYVSVTSVTGSDLVPVIWMGFPVDPGQTQTSSILVAEIDLRDIWRRIDEVSIGKTGRAYVVSSDGIIIAHPDRSYIGQALAPALQPVLAGFEGHTIYADPTRNRSWLASYSPVGGASGWGIVVEQQQSEAFAYINTIAYITLGVLFLAAMIGVLTTILVTRSITQPLQRLTVITRQIALTGQLTHEIPVEGKDEIAQLATTINQMIASLRLAEATLQEYSVHLEETVDQRTQELGEAQEQLLRKEKLATLGQLSGSIAHELRNPLGVISNAVYYLQLVVEDKTEIVKEYLDLLTAEINKAKKIVSDLLDFSRTRLPAKQAVSVAWVVSKVFENHPPPNNIDVDQQLSQDLPSVIIDPQQIEQVLENLITNAYQAMPGGGRLTVKATQEANQVWISIRDSGCGISKENLTKIFEPLFTTKPRGIGLGLALSKNFVEGNDGKITVESEPGIGSTFTLRFPVTRADSTPSVQPRGKGVYDGS